MTEIAALGNRDDAVARHCEEQSDDAIQTEGIAWIASPSVRDDGNFLIPERPCPQPAA
jgi:hypothetical protein